MSALLRTLDLALHRKHQISFKMFGWISLFFFSSKEKAKLRQLVFQIVN